MGAVQREWADVALGFLTLPNATPGDLVEAAAKAGFRRVTLRIAGRAKGDADLVNSPALLKEAEAALQANGVALTHMGGVWCDGTRPPSEFEHAIETGRRLGTDMCVAIFTPGRPQSQIQDEFADLCRLAARYQMRVALEFAAYVGVRSLTEAVAMVEGVHLPNAGILVDALHLFRAGHDAQTVADAPVSRLFCAQLSDATTLAPPLERLQTEARGNRLDPGLGELPLVELMQALPADCALELEAPCLAYRNMTATERARAAAAALRSFFKSSTLDLR